MLSRSQFTSTSSRSSVSELISSFVHDTLKTVGRDMKGREVGEQDVEEHVSYRNHVCVPRASADHIDDASKGEVSCR
jgi:hypothetical protein